MIPDSNGTTTSVTHETAYDKNTALFWVLVVFYLCIALVATIGNALVIYAAYGNNNKGPLRYIDDVVKSLAIADMLYGLIGTPFLIYGYFLGEFLNFYSNINAFVLYVKNLI